MEGREPQAGTKVKNKEAAFPLGLKKKTCFIALMDSLEHFARKKLAEIRVKGLFRQTLPTERKAHCVVKRDGKTYISFSDNDYLGLSCRKEVIAAGKQALERFGAGAGASRLITGDHPLYRDLEKKIAAFKEAEDACVFGSGYLTNVGIIPILAGSGDLILADRLCHACIYAGGQLSKADFRIYRHNDLDHLRELLEKHSIKARHTLILTDGVFSMDGDRAPVRELAALARKFNAWLMVDDAHGFGVIEGGKGSSFEKGIKQDVPLQMGTLSKAVGSYGGYIVAVKPVIDLIRNRARSLIYTTGLPPSAVGASLKGLEIIEKNPRLCGKALQHAEDFCRALNLPKPQSAIVPLVLGEPEIAMQASKKLAEKGFLVHAIRPPTVPEGTARLRFAFSAAHRKKDVEKLIDAVKETGLVK